MSSIPQTRPSSGRSRRFPIALIVAAVLVVALIATFAVRTFTAGPADPLEGATLAPVAVGDLTLGVSATGQVEPRVEAELAFSAASGRVAEVLVETGDTVEAGAPLIALDSRQLAAEVAAAQANLAAAQADLAGVSERATPAQIAAAQADVAAAQGSLTETQGRVTAADLQAARAAVEEARAKLAALEAGPKSDERTRAEADLAEARADLEFNRSLLASDKEAARVLVETRTNNLRTLQDTYSRIYWENRELDENLDDLPQARIDLEASALRDVQNAEAALFQAQRDYETAQQREISALQTAQARVDSAQADLDELLTGADADELAEARARLARAQADLAELTSSERTGAIANRAAGLEAAQARLQDLTADPKASDLARAQARVAQAEAQLEQARIRLDDAVLRAPFAGVIAGVNVAPGEAISAQITPVVLIDISRFLVKVTVDEVDIGRVSVGQTVQVLIDALGAPAITGTVVRFEPLPSGESAVTSYQVTVEIDPAERPLKAGMTASATIVADQRSGVLTVPVTAVRSEGGKNLVTVAVTGADGATTVSDREVQVGLRTTDRVEITGGLSEGEQVVIR